MLPELLTTIKIGFTHWDNRIAPVFDTAPEILILTLAPDPVSKRPQIINRINCRFPDCSAEDRLDFLLSEEIRILICGAITHQLANKISSSGIRLLAFIAGDLNRVIEAVLTGTIDRQEFIMPGCRRQRRGCCRRIFEKNRKNKGGE